MIDSTILRRLPLLLVAIVWLGGDKARTQDADTLADPSWRYTTSQPSGEWQAPSYDDSDWKEGDGGFGTRGTPGARISTIWRKPKIWLRRTVELKDVPEQPALYMFHDEDAEVFINGERAASLEGYVTEYKVVPLEEAARKALRAGENVVAVHCRQSSGGQAIDVHLIDAKHVPRLPPAKRPTTPFKSDLMTRWGEQVTAENVWQEYPRPQLTRPGWRNLNGKWDYAVTPQKQTETPSAWDGEILVPFCIESKLSGVQRLLNPEETLWYHLEFEASPQSGQRTMLRFEAVDYRCDVLVNDVRVGSHTGGNTPFSFDITDAVRSGKNKLIVRVDDDTEGFQLRGKQSLNPAGIFYTQVSGIWQTVWLEEVPQRHIESIKITNDENSTLTIRTQLGGKAGNDEKLRVVVLDGERQVAEAVGTAEQVQLKIPEAKLWSPSEPHLYQLDVVLLGSHDSVIDKIGSYTGIRTVGKTRDAEGNLRFTLNGETIFHWGPLDQGWWPDGLLTPPSDEAMKFDIAFLQDAGFNMIRKHIKVEPRRYYYHCDQMGMMVWQDHVSGGENPPWTRLAPDPVDATWSDEHHEQFMAEFEAMVDTLENHPSIVVWTPFNEAWGQHRTVEVGKWIERRDPTRLINIASGGNFWPVGDVVDEHAYPHPSFPFNQERFKDFIHVVGEFGGHGLPSPGHLWDKEAENWGYGGLPKNKAEYQERYRESIRRLIELKAKGIAAGVYTQTTDVEGEINGIMSYDREVIKIPAEELRAIHAPLLE